MSKNREIYLEHINNLSEAVDKEIADFRQTIHIEHRDIRKEFNEAVAKAYLEMGEAPKALREKVNQVELFMRDQFLLKTDYEKDHDRLLKTIEMLGESIDRRLDKFEKKLDEQRETT